EHQLTAQPLPQWMLRGQRIQLRHNRLVASERELGLHALLDRREPEIVQPLDLLLGERVVGEVSQRRPAPEGESSPKQLQCLSRSRRGVCAAALFEQPLELECVY